MKYLVVAGLAVSLLAGCAQLGGSGPELTPKQKLAQRCEVYIGLMDIAVANKQQMPSAARQSVGVFRETALPKCENLDDVEDPTSALQTVDQAISTLRTIEVIQKETQE